MPRPEVPQGDIGFGQGITRDQWQEIKDWWVNGIVPQFKDWIAPQIEEGAQFLRTNRVSAVELVRSKLQGGTRLVIMGMTQHPSFDHLPVQIIQQVPGVDFIAVEARGPDDKTGGLQEDKQGFASIDLGGGVIVNLSHEEAKRKYPEKYRDPDAPNTAFNHVIAAAREFGIDVLHSMKGATWREMNRLAAEELAVYMQKHPGARGVYFSSIYSALKWPGYETEEEHKELGFSRPLGSDHIFSTNPRTDTSVRMSAYALHELFPDQVYSMAQFVMPRGYGAEWKNLRSAVEASGIQERFAIDNVPSTPFAIQRYLFRGLAELSDTPDEELWKYFGTMAQGFFGPVEVRWDKVLDGVIIYPSDKPLLSSPTSEQMMEAAAKYIAEALKAD